jgi:uncharacterized protein involved in oxidation of intracellular sulfur
MKINVFLLFFLFSGMQLFGQNGKSVSNPVKSNATTIGMVIYSNDAETVWNALRLANYSKNQGDSVSIFLLGKGVELDSMVKTNTDLKEQSEKFLDNGGSILGCGTCLRSRNNKEPQVCKFSSLADLYKLIRNNKIVLTF